MNSPELKYFIQQTIPTLVNSYIETFKSIPIKFNNADSTNLTLELQDLWVNFQKKHEFNPIHDHNGAFSFVIWMKIPTSSKEQNTSSISSNSGTMGLVSNFSFVYTDILGNIRNYVYEMEKRIVGYMVMFPSRLHHQVFPFYDNQDSRVSISGNLGIVKK